MMAAVHVRPNDVLPTSMSLMRLLVAARRLKYAMDWSYLNSLKSAPTLKPKTDSGVGIAERCAAAFPAVHSAPTAATAVAMERRAGRWRRTAQHVARIGRDLRRLVPDAGEDGDVSGLIEGAGGS